MFLLDQMLQYGEKPMRLDKLKITSQWKNLSGFCIDFDESRDITVLIGRNGSAKSNLLEALILIFSELGRHGKSPFSYELEYDIEGKHVHLIGEAGKAPTGQVDGQKAPLNTIRESLLPKYIVGYYSGTSDRFKELFYPYDKEALGKTLGESPDNAKLELRRFIYARPIHGLFSLLAFYFSDDKEVVKFLEELPRIEAFDSVLITLKEPRWAKKGSTADDFWGATGPVLNLLKAIKRYSLAPFSTKATIKTDFTRKETKEFIYLYLPDLHALRSLAKEYGDDPGAFFQALDTMRLSELIDDNSFRVNVSVKGVNGAIHTRQLSEGEQQLLTVLGLMRFTRKAGSLYLLDEPDTHLNPAWGVEYLERLRKIGGIDSNSHTLLATHDPLLVSGLLKEEIRALYRNASGQIIAVEPEESPRGTGVSGVLTSPLFGLESQLDPYSLGVLKQIYEISIDKNYPDRKQELARLRKLVPGLSPTDSSPDPYRNIAKLAYELATDRVLETDKDHDWKSKAIERLTSKLYEEAGAIKE
jgi:predicted ATPase